MKCKNCGAKIPVDRVICDKCGASQTSESAERMGFEPMWACTLTVFKTAPL